MIQARLGKLPVWSLIRLVLGLTAVSTFLSNELMGALRDGFVRERSLYLFMLTNAFLAGACTQSFRTVLREMLLAVPLGVLQKGEYERLSTDKGSPPRRRSEKNGSCRSCSSKSDSEMAEITAILGADPIDDDIMSKLSDSPTLGVRGSSSNRFDSFRLLPQFYAEQHHDGVTYIEDPSQRLRYQLMVKDGKLIDVDRSASLSRGCKGGHVHYGHERQRLRLFRSPEDVPPLKLCCWQAGCCCRHYHGMRRATPSNFQ